MAGHRIMLVALHPLLLHIGNEIVRVIHRDYKQMEHRVRVLWMRLHGNPWIRDFPYIAPADLPAARRPLGQILKTHAKDGSLQSLQPVIISNYIMIIPDLTPLVLKGGDGVKIFLFIAGNAPPFPEGVQILTWIKTKTPQFSQASCHFSFIKGAVCLGTVLHHIKPVLIGDFLHPAKCKGLTV